MGQRGRFSQQDFQGLDFWACCRSRSLIGLTSLRARSTTGAEARRRRNLKHLDSWLPAREAVSTPSRMQSRSRHEQRTNPLALTADARRGAQVVHEEGGCVCSCHKERIDPRAHPLTPGAEHRLCTEKGEPGAGLSCSHRSSCCTSDGCPPPRRQARPIMCRVRPCDRVVRSQDSSGGVSTAHCRLRLSLSQRQPHGDPVCALTGTSRQQAQAQSDKEGSHDNMYLCEQHLAAAQGAAPAHVRCQPRGTCAHATVRHDADALPEAYAAVRPQA